MTLNEAISSFRETHVSAFDDEILVRWLSEAEYMVVDEVFLTHEDVPRRAASFCGYSFLKDRNTRLLIPEPYSQVYVDYLSMKSDISLSDIQRYNNSAALFYNSYSTFADWYNRCHMPLKRVSDFKLK